MIDALPLLLGPEGYQISRSVRLRSSASAFFNRTFSSSGTDLKMWTLSFWMKRGRLGVQSIPFSSQDTPGTGASSLYFIIASNDTIGVFFPNTGATLSVGTSAVLRDPSAWYHIVFAWDSTQATSTNRIKIYINGVQQTLAAGGTYPSLNATTSWNSNCAHFISKNPVGSSDYFDGYFTEINSIDGQALTPASFGETNPVTGVWQPKKYTGTYGTNGFYLNFSDNSAATAAAIGKDYSGNGNNWTPNNISVTAGVTYDSMLDVPTQWADGGNGRGNYAVMNPLAKSSVGTLDNANMRWTSGNSGVGTNGNGTRVSVGVSTGKWYAECTVLDTVFWSYPGVSNESHSTATYNGGDANSWSVSSSGQKVTNNSATAYGSATWAANDIVNIAYDADNGELYFGKNGTWLNSGNPATRTNPAFTGLSGTLFFTIGFSANTASASQVSFNCGQQPFANSVPTGFKALNTLNLPTPTILKGNQYFDVALQTGNTTGRTVSGLAFQPDLVWVKNRAGSTNRRWGVIDSVRGVNKTLSTALADAEVTSQTDLLTAFNSDGFTIGADAGLYGWNGFAESYAHFTWKEGATQGFDIVTYTGDGTSPRNISHSLGVIPAMVIVKSRSAVASWMVKHKNLSSNNNLFLEGTNAQLSPGNGYIQDLNNSSTFGVVNGGGGVANINANGTTYVAYLFSEVAGFSKFGSYTGNGSADGPMIFTGFRPRFILIKESTPNARGWRIFDTARSPFNQAGLTLSPNTADAEDTGSGLYNQMDILSNGFKLRAGTNSEPTNESGATYIYAAFAEVPFRNSLAR